MKLQLATGALATELDFTIFENVGKIRLAAGFLGHFDKVGLCFSGGPDSVALLCLILTELKSTGLLGKIPVTCFTVLKNDGCTYYADRLLAVIRKKFDCEIEHVTNIENPYVDKLPSWFDGHVLIDIVNMKKNMLLYNSMNLPPIDITEFRHTSPANIGDDFIRDLHIVTPFYRMHKPQILDILYKLGCNDLLQYTHSCVMLPIGTCNDCFSCEERAWGFKELGKTDPGTITPDVEDITYGGTWKFE